MYSSNQKKLTFCHLQLTFCTTSLSLLPCSPGGRAPGVCSVPFLPERPSAGQRLRGSHRERAGHLRRVQPKGCVQLPQRLPLPILGAVHRPQTLVPAGNQRGAGLHLPGLCHSPAQPLDRRHYCKSTISFVYDVSSYPPLLFHLLLFVVHFPPHATSTTSLVPSSLSSSSHFLLTPLSTAQ